jgi:hypothetical protein
MATDHFCAEVQVLVDQLEALRASAVALQRELVDALSANDGPRRTIARSRSPAGRGRSARGLRSSSNRRARAGTRSQRVEIDLTGRDLSMIAPEILNKSDDDTFECPVCLDTIRFGDITFRNPSKWTEAMHEKYSFGMTRDCSTHLFCDTCFERLPRNICAVCRHPLTAEGEIAPRAQQSEGSNVLVRVVRGASSPEALERALGNAVMRLVMQRGH